VAIHCGLAVLGLWPALAVHKVRLPAGLRSDSLDLEKDRTMSTTSTTPQQELPISARYAVPVVTRASNPTAPRFNPTMPAKSWEGHGSFQVFDAGNSVNGYLTAIDVPVEYDAINIPGAPPYPEYVSPPTDAMLYGPFPNQVVPVSPDTVCLLSDAQEIAREIAPLYPGKTMILVESPSGVFHIVYDQDPRRQYNILAGGVIVGNAQAFIGQKYRFGVGSPYHWVMQGNVPTTVQDNPPTQPPVGSVPVPVPIQLNPGETIVPRPGLPGATGENSFMIVDQSNGAAQALAAAQAALDTYNQLAGKQAIITGA
jgi:hypothetical protein